MSICGNGRLEAGEECDDGNALSSDGCLATCFRPPAWVAGDTHLHGHGCEGAAGPQDLVRLLARRRLNVASALVWGEGYQSDRPFFSGEDDPLSLPDRILHYDLEVSKFAADRGGHLILLGLRSIDFSPNPFLRPLSGLPVAAWARDQAARVLIGLAHPEHWPADGSFPRDTSDCCTPFELPVHAARGDLAFVQTVQRGERGLLDPAALFVWGQLQNSGVRVALLGGSDYPCEKVPAEGALQTHALLDGPTTYESWLAALRRGRAVTSIGAGDALNLRVNGARLGDELRARAGETLALSIEAELAEPGDVQILVNGVPEGRVRLAAGPQAVRAELTLSSSAWLAARSTRSITNAVYVLVEGRPIRNAQAACYWMRYLDHLVTLVQRGSLELRDEAPQAIAAYRQARGFFEARFSEAGGGDCR